MKVVISEDERFPVYSIDVNGYHDKKVIMTLKKYLWCTRAIREFNKVQTYLEKRYEA